MKKVMVIIILLVCISIAYAITEYATLNQNSSYIIKDKNITLLGISDDEESVLICVNSEKAILSEDRTINNVYLSLRKVEDGSADIRIEYKCPNCFCSKECSNELCYKTAKETNTPSKNKTESNAIEKVTSSTIKNIKIRNNELQKNMQDSSLAIAIALILSIFIIALIIIKKI